MSKNILIVAAHPDDETLGAGGSIARHIENGDLVKVVILGTGIASRNEDNLEEKLKELRENSKNALKVIGVEDVLFYDYPDNRFDTVPLLEIIKTIENNIDEFKPNIIYTHNYNDLNIDHRITYEAVITATRPVKDYPEEILSFEVLSSTEWKFGSQGVFCPNYFIDITKTFDKKLDALREYKTEMREPPHPRSLEIVTALSRLRGSMSNTKYAEAFEMIRVVKK